VSKVPDPQAVVGTNCNCERLFWPVFQGQPGPLHLYHCLYNEIKAYDELRPYLSDHDLPEDTYPDEGEEPYLYCRDNSKSVCVDETWEWNLAQERRFLRGKMYGV